jgi:hypothetical protein
VQLLAIITMLIDHIGIVFYPDNPILRMIGRLAFPLYAHGIVNGLRYTSNRRRYIRRLAIIAAAAQLPYMMALDVWGINVVGTFLVVIGVLQVIERYKENKLIGVCVILLAGLLMDELYFDYGSYALFLIMIYRYLSAQWMVAAHMLLNVVYFLYANWVLQLASVLATCLLVYGQPLLSAINRMKVPRWLWVSFYPAHLFVLYLVFIVIG